jgi:hypothetical protein
MFKELDRINVEPFIGEPNGLTVGELPTRLSPSVFTKKQNNNCLKGGTKEFGFS